jgi:hypothetical protein
VKVEAAFCGRKEMPSLQAVKVQPAPHTRFLKLPNRPARLDLTFYPYLPTATVGATDTRAYLGLVAKAGAQPTGAGASA